MTSKSLHRFNAGSQSPIIFHHSKAQAPTPLQLAVAYPQLKPHFQSQQRPESLAVMGAFWKTSIKLRDVQLASNTHMLPRIMPTRECTSEEIG